MGNFTWEGWQTSAEDAPQPTSILYGKNLKTSSSKSSQEEQPHPQVEEKQAAQVPGQSPAK
jgi:predicted negative regulator of RcsB-dependent stress response